MGIFGLNYAKNRGFLHTVSKVLSVSGLRVLVGFSRAGCLRLRLRLTAIWVAFDLDLGGV